MYWRLRIEREVKGNLADTSARKQLQNGKLRFATVP